MKSKSRFCEACPLRLSNRPTDPCPRALERIHALQAEGAKSKVDTESLPGCPWAVNSAAHNYCFWNLVAELDEPMSDREICNMLGINQQTLDKTLQAALLKLQSLRGTDVMDAFVEAVIESVKQQDPDHTVYLPDSYARDAELAADAEEDEDAKLADEPKKPRKGLGQPVHRSGEKVDLFGLYGRKKLAEMKKKRHESKK